MLIRQKYFLGALIVANVWAWAVPSDVVELVARGRHTLLGRYSREHMVLNLVILVVSVVGYYVDRATGTSYRRRWFQVVAVGVFLVPSVVVIDFAVRTVGEERYVFDSLAYHRPPNTEFTRVYDDRPVAARTYPNAAPGFAPVSCAYQTDANGFRNPGLAERYEIVVLGDSFAEGSKVSNEHAWPVRLAASSGRTVYNLGMSGYGPTHYRAALERYGLALSPSVVVCMLYEGNDFRGGGVPSSGDGRGWGKRLKTYFKQSPVRSAIDRALIDWLGPIGAHREVPELSVLSWLPLAIPDGPDARFYTFAPKQILSNLRDVEWLRAGKTWLSVSAALGEIQSACDEIGAMLVIVYAPTKAHVVLPLVRDSLDARKVRAFASLRARGLPPPEEFLAHLFRDLGAMERVVAEWCASRDVPFVSTTTALREGVAAGLQVYYTYDQHWTPIGHAVVADVVRGAIGKLPSAEETIDVTNAAAFNGSALGDE